MGHKIHPKNFRLGYLFFWDSKWFKRGKSFRDALKEDYYIREFLLKKFKDAAISSVEIKRFANAVDVNIYTARPGMIIGKGGNTIEQAQKELKKMISSDLDLKVNLKETEHPESSACLIAQSIVENLERRMPYRRVVKRALERHKDSPDLEGIKIVIAGRLDGAEIARRERFEWGRMPLHTLRANIDFTAQKAKTKYGTIGVKVWVYRGEIFQKFQDNAPDSSFEEKNKI